MFVSAGFDQRDTGDARRFDLRHADLITFGTEADRGKIAFHVEQREARSADQRLVALCPHAEKCRLFINSASIMKPQQRRECRRPATEIIILPDEIVDGWNNVYLGSLIEFYEE